MNNELIELAKKCKSAEEIIALAKERGVELTDNDLDAVCGGLFLGIQLTGTNGSPVCEDANGDDGKIPGGTLGFNVQIRGKGTTREDE